MPGRTRKKPPRHYHHGDLRSALVETSAAIVDRQGSEALTLREVARQLGVSHAAPSHHFADKTALLGAVAAMGFEALAASLERAIERAGDDPLERLKASGVAYVRFALDYPERFRLMFGPELVSAKLEDLACRSTNAFEILVRSVTDALAARTTPSPERVRLATVSAWSLVHGLATLSIDRRLELLGITSDAETVQLARVVADLVARSLEA